MEYHVVEVNKAVAADASAKVYISPPSGQTWKVKSIAAMPCLNSTANASNYASIRPYKDTATPTALAAARTTETSGLTAGTLETFTLTATGLDLEITTTDPFYLLIDATPGTGVAVDLTAVVEFEVLRT